MPHVITLPCTSETTFTVHSAGLLGGTALSQPQPLPYNNLTLLGVLAALEPARDPFVVFEANLRTAVLSALRQAGLLRSDGTPLPDLAVHVGRRLWQLLTADPRVAGLLATDRANAQARGQRLDVVVQTGPGDVPLARLPWELLHDDHGFLLQQGAVTLTRHVQFERATPRLKVAGPIRILLIEARPVRVPALPVGREHGVLASVLARLQDPGLVTLERLQPPTYDALVNRLSDADDVHVIHFDGHGGFDGRASFLVFENQYCERQDVDAARFAAALAGKKVKLLYASACQTAAAGADSIFTGLGPGLLVAGVPAIVSMQFSVMTNAAETFLGRFYRSVALGKPLPDSLADARQLLYGPQFGHAWATPVLYLRSRDTEGKLLEVRQKR